MNKSLYDANAAVIKYAKWAETDEGRKVVGDSASDGMSEMRLYLDDLAKQIASASNDIKITSITVKRS